MKLASLHRWLGLALSASLLIMSVSGTMLLWKREYLFFTIPEAQQKLNIQAQSLATSIDTILSHYPPDTVKFVQLHSDDLSIHKVFLSDKHYAWHSQNGRQLEVWQANHRFEDWLLDLHHRFLLGNTVGLNIAGFSGLILLSLMLIGFYLWWPRRKSLQLGLYPKYKNRDAWRISHANLGALSIVPIFVLSFTGVILVYPQQARTILLDSVDSASTTIVEQQQLAHQPSISGAFSLLEEYFPGARAKWISLPSTENNQFSIGLKRAGAWNVTGQSSLTFLAGGELRVKQAQQQSRVKRVYDFSYPLHAGKLPWQLRLLLTIFGLALSLLCIMGVRSYFYKRSTGSR